MTSYLPVAFTDSLPFRLEPGNAHPSGSTLGDDVQLVDPRHPDWDKWAGQFAGNSIFHSSSWAEVLRLSYGHRPCYLALLQNGRPSALLPIMEINSPLTGRRGVSLPFSDHCQALASDTHAVKVLVDSALELGAARGWRSLELRGSMPDSKPALRSFYGHALDLEPGPEKIFSKLDSSVRRAVRKAERSKLNIETSNSLESVRTFYRLHCLTRRKHGAPPQPFYFFENIHKCILERELGQVILARENEKAIAGAVFFHTGRTAFYKFGASNPAFQARRGNNQVIWKAIEWYANRQYETLEFGRTDLSNEGLRRFKQGWGTDERTVAYSKHDFRRNRYVEEAGLEGSRLGKVAEFLPLWMLRAFGRLIYPHIA